MNKTEFYDVKTLSKTLYLDRVNGNYIAKLQNEINKTEGMQVVATTIEPVVCIGGQGATSGKFYCWVYLKSLPNIKLNLEEIFKQKEAQSLLK